METAGDGPDGLRRSFDADIDRMAAQLAVTSPGRRLVVLDGMAIRLDEYLRTRILELVVHTDDLAVSIGQTAESPPAAVAIAVSLLTALARRRRGDMALVRALARRERTDDRPLAL